MMLSWKELKVKNEMKNDLSKKKNNPQVSLMILIGDELKNTKKS